VIARSGLVRRQSDSDDWPCENRSIKRLRVRRRFASCGASTRRWCRGRSRTKVVRPEARALVLAGSRAQDKGPVGERGLSSSTCDRGAETHVTVRYGHDTTNASFIMPFRRRSIFLFRSLGFSSFSISASNSRTWSGTSCVCLTRLLFQHVPNRPKRGALQHLFFARLPRS
jgi:hypothetical protein